MRKWHRWLVVFFGVFMLWIAVTGVLSYMAEWWPSGQPSPEAVAAMVPPPNFTCPDGWRCLPGRPPGGGMRSLVGWFHHLHSGEEFGIFGEVIGFLSGLALIFFSFSGIWMYVQMWRARGRRGAEGKLFWK